MSGVYKANFASWLTLPTDTTLPNLGNNLKLILWAKRLNIMADVGLWGLFVPHLSWLI